MSDPLDRTPFFRESPLDDFVGDIEFDWPDNPWEATGFFDPCPCCDLGNATFGSGIAFECPACAGSGIAGEHDCG